MQRKVNNNYYYRTTQEFIECKGYKVSKDIQADIFIRKQDKKYYVCDGYTGLALTNNPVNTLQEARLEGEKIAPKLLPDILTRKGIYFGVSPRYGGDIFCGRPDGFGVMCRVKEKYTQAFEQIFNLPLGRFMGLSHGGFNVINFAEALGYVIDGQEITISDFIRANYSQTAVDLVNILVGVNYYAES